MSTTMTAADWGDILMESSDEDDLLAFCDWLEDVGDGAVAPAVRDIASLVRDVRDNMHKIEHIPSRYPKEIRYVTVFPDCILPHYHLQAASVYNGHLRVLPRSSHDAIAALWGAYRPGRTTRTYPVRLWFENAAGLAYCVIFGWNGDPESGTPLLRFKLRQEHEEKR